MATKEVLLRLRRVRELELRRALAAAGAARTEARRAGTAAEAARRRLEDALERARRARTLWTGPRPAGRLARAVDFEGTLRHTLAEAQAREHAALVTLDAAERALKTAQTQLGDAVHARQRSESVAAAERTAAARARERREHAETEDRYRRAAAQRPAGSLTPRSRRS